MGGGEEREGEREREKEGRKWEGGGEEREGARGKRKGRRIRGVEGVRRERETCYLPQMFIRSNHNPSSDQIFMDVFHFFFFLFSFVPFSSPLSAPLPNTHTPFDCDRTCPCKCQRPLSSTRSLTKSECCPQDVCVWVCGGGGGG